MIEKEDVVEALAIFVARYVVSLPQAQDMEPKARPCTILTVAISSPRRPCAPFSLQTVTTHVLLLVVPPVPRYGGTFTPP